MNAMTRVSVNKEVLLWALERSGLAVETIQTRFPKIRQWEEGTTQPTLRQLEDLARATHTPFGYFFLPAPPDERLPIPYFRTVADQTLAHPSADLLETVHTMQQRQEYMRELLIDQGEPPLPFVRSASVSDDPIHVAASIREALGRNTACAAAQRTWTDALRDFENAIERLGVLVMANGVVGNNNHRKLSPAEFRGFVLVDEYSPLVFINSADGKAAQMFTLAHELAHVWFGSSAAFDLRELQPADDATEQACNKVAAEILVPESELRELWRTVRNDAEPFQSIARHFKVSALVAARRVLDLGLIQRTDFLQFYQAYLEDERRRRGEGSEGGNFYANQVVRIGHRFGEAIVRAAKEGKLLYYEAYKLTGLRGKTFDQFASTLLGEPAA